MKTIQISISIIFLFGLAGTVFATSPQPEEVKPGAKVTVCTMRVIYSPDTEKGIEKSSVSASVSFDASVSRKDVLDKISERISDKLNEADVAGFGLECRFAK